MGAGGSQSTTNQGSKARAGELSTTAAAMLAIGKHDSAANAAASNITAGFPVGN